VVRPARQHELVAARQGVRVRGRDGTDQKPSVDVDEGRRARSPGGQEHTRIPLGGNGFCRLDVGAHDDRITGVPGGAGQHHMRQPQLAAHGRGVGCDRGGVRMGGVDDGVDLEFDQPLPHPLDTAEPADAHLAHRQRGLRYTARERADHIDVRMKSRGEGTRLSSAAEQQDPHQCRPRRTRPDE